MIFLKQGRNLFGYLINQKPFSESIPSNAPIWCVNGLFAQWQGIEGLMQFDLSTFTPWIEHTLRVMLKLESFLAEDEAEPHPICHQIFSHISDRTLLYVAALFHDIAKGRGGDHAELGG